MPIGRPKLASGKVSSVAETLNPKPFFSERFSSPEVVRLLNEEAPESAGITKADLLKARQG